MDLALAQLALLFLPGIIWAAIDSKYGAGLKPDQFALVVRSFLFGVTTHAILYLIYSILGYKFGYVDFVKSDKGIILLPLMDEIV